MKKPYVEIYYLKLFVINKWSSLQVIIKVKNRRYAFSLEIPWSQSVMEMKGFRHNKLKCILWIFLVDLFLFWNLEKFSRTAFSYGPDVQHKAL